MKLPELSIRQASDMIFSAVGIVGGAALYDQYFGHPMTITGIVGLFTIILAVSAVFYLHYERTPLDSILEMMG